jgi:hypothetical protein
MEATPMPQQDFDTGLGTTYERFALYGWLDKLCDTHAIQTVLEGPDDGMTGIPGLNSLVFGRRGCAVTVALEQPAAIALARRAWQSQGCAARVQFLRSSGWRLPVADSQFDLVWNFNRLPFCPPRQLIAEMARVARRYVLLGVPNRANYGFLARQISHWLTRAPWPYGDSSVMDRRAVARLLAAHGLRVVSTAFVDVPWWPDIIDIRQFALDLLPFLAGALPQKGPPALCWGPEDLPYFAPERYAALHQRMRRLAFIERLPSERLRQPFAHHFMILAATAGGTL